MAATLAQLRDRVETLLQDTTNAIWSTDDLDEAIRQALALYDQVNPDEAIATITLTSGGREIDISSLGYTTVERVWRDYDASNPAYPPNWRDFEVWPGDILFIKDDEEPSSGDTVRIWYTKPHTLNGLDGATSTTVPEHHESLIVTGAAAIAAHMRATENSEEATVDGWPHRRYMELAAQWADTFHTRLALIARENAARWSGIAPGPTLDRWEDEWA